MKTSAYTVPHMASLLVRTGLGLVFLWASWDKIGHPAEFASIIDNYRILPAAAVNPVAVMLPWVEFICALLLLSGRLVPGAVLTIDLLLRPALFSQHQIFKPAWPNHCCQTLTELII